MKRDFLKGLGIEDALIDKIMAEHGKDFGELETMKQNVTAKQAEVDELKALLATRDSDIETLKASKANGDELQKQLNELQKKYDADTKAAQKKLDDQQKEFRVTRATEKFFSTVAFSSELARKAAMQEFKDKAFQLGDDDNFVGGKEWLDNLKTTSPDAFKIDDTGKPNSPTFTNPSGNNNGSTPGGGSNTHKLPIII